MIYVLVLVLMANNGVVVMSQEFTSLERCEAATRMVVGAVNAKNRSWAVLDSARLPK